jgi:hypothetical protein
MIKEWIALRTNSNFLLKEKSRKAGITVNASLNQIFGTEIKTSLIFIEAQKAKGRTSGRKNIYGEKKIIKLNEVIWKY